MLLHTRWLFLLSVALLFTGACNQETAKGRDTNPASATEVAPVRKQGITDDYTSTNRLIWQKPDLVMDLLGDMDGKTVADIGAGTGFFSLRIIEKAAKVIAIDIDQRFLNYLDSIKMLELNDTLRQKLETRLATPDNPNLKAAEADLVLIVNTYMYLKDRVGYLRNLKSGIAEGGKIIIIDFKRKRMPIGPPQNIRVPLFVTEEELYEAGYREVITNDSSLDYQYIITARK